MIHTTHLKNTFKRRNELTFRINKKLNNGDLIFNGLNRYFTYLVKCNLLSFI